MNRALTPIFVLGCLLAAAARGEPVEGVPKAELQLLAEVVRHIKRDFARAVDDAVLASGCADAVAAASGTAERAALDLDAIPPLLIRAKTVAPAEVGYRRLVHSCIEGMVSMLDTHSQFMSELEFRSLYRGGLGVAATGLELRKYRDAALVIEVFDGTPAAKAGVRSGDRILRIDYGAIDALPLNEVMSRLRGAAGSQVVLTLERAGTARPLELIVKREVVRLATVRVSWGEGDVLRLRIVRFVEGTRNELLRELARLADGATREPRGIVLDLRDNTGGTLLAAVDVSGVFLEDGLEVGATRGRGQKLIASYRANERDRVSYYGPAVPMQLSHSLKRAPLAVLVNERTASGAEILAAALRGNGRARLVGGRTVGMGSVQTLFPLAGGAALKVTTAFWHAPRDVPLDGRPLDPDLAAGGEVALREALRWLGEAGARK